MTPLISLLFTLPLSVESPVVLLHLFCAGLTPKREDEIEGTEQPMQETRSAH